MSFCRFVSLSLVMQKVYGNLKAKRAKLKGKTIWYFGEPGELYDEAFEVKSTKNEKVGPWSGWDSKIKSFAIETEKIDLQELNDIDRIIPKVGRPKL